jgi:uncharacterized protein
MANNLNGNESEVFKVLSLDGGGIKGLYITTILEHLEQVFRILFGGA